MLMKSSVSINHCLPSVTLIHQSAGDLLTLQSDLCLLTKKVLMRFGDVYWIGSFLFVGGWLEEAPVMHVIALNLYISPKTCFNNWFADMQHFAECM